MGKLLLAILVVGILFFLVQRSKGAGEVAQANIQLGQQFLEENQKNVDVKVTDSGLQYERLVEGDGKVHPKASDKVLVHYHGTLIDGTVFDSSVNRGEPISFGLSQVIKGWTEGLQLMVEGDKYRLTIPSTLAYGNRAVGSIPPGSVLVFEVELLKINP